LTRIEKEMLLREHENEKREVNRERERARIRSVICGSIPICSVPIILPQMAQMVADYEGSNPRLSA